MVRARWDGVEHFYAAAEAFVERCLRADDSLMTPERRIWSQELVQPEIRTTSRE
jgi:hypothetical protein